MHNLLYLLTLVDDSLVGCPPLRMMPIPVDSMLICLDTIPVFYRLTETKGNG